jgi:Protein phosphatase 2A regulatory B subunit (B56 family).
MDIIDSHSSVHTKDLKPKTKLDFLAEKVLSATALFPQLSPHCFDCQDQPFLGALEKVVGVNHEVILKAPEGIGPITGLLTCTNAPNCSQRSNDPKFSERSRRKDYYSSPLSADTDMLAPSLEDYAPFSEDFFRFFGQMIVCAYSSAAGPYKAEIKKDTANDDGQPKEQYSLYQSIDAIRVTRILSVVMEFNILGCAADKYSIKEHASPNENDFDRVCFLDLLLYYTEGNNNIEVQDGHSVGEGPSLAQQAVPLLNSVFKHFAALPHLEGHVHTMTRLFRASAPPITQTQDGTSAVLKLAHMEKTEAYKERLEEEFRNHVSSLERIAGLMYERGDCTVRSKARLKIGALLQSYSLSNGINRSLGLGGLHLGVENTGAAFVEPLLNIVLRILRGIKGSESGEYVVPKSYKHLLREVLLPLHKPSGMTLWRDQQPLLGLYHKVLVQCIGALVSIDKSLIAEVIKQIIHPDIWPLEGKREGSGTTSAANTPKLVLLLHEIDTYLGLLDLHSDTTDPILSDEIIPLVLRLCSCISSDNSRSSERALEFFKNKSFKILVRIHLRTLMRPLLGALCRVDAGMDVPWNPTVRKMTLLVLKELETVDAKLFAESFRDLYSSRQSQWKKEEVVAPKPINHAMTTQTKKYVGQVPPTDTFSLKRSMGDWRPPLKNHVPFMDTKKQPTSVSTSSMPPPKSRMPHSTRNKVPPPLTVTGVAPWAMNPSSSLLPKPQKSNLQRDETTTKTHSERADDNMHSVPKQHELASLKRKDHASNRDMYYQGTSKSIEHDPLACLKEYMDKLKSPSSTTDSESDDGFSGWAKAQMAESPVLLPDLKFHDLVFGDVLGTGAFSTVKVSGRF